MQILSQDSVDGQARRIRTNCQEKKNKHSREFSARTSVDAALIAKNHNMPSCSQQPRAADATH